ncbi:Ribonuclease III [hydrothermal vent metagenome]|uniref:ribonuclease III n=1 Tax=hydrothermal vent metagenome TaxID=652676 RepID=A0A3B1AV50_9ZZZZ
MRQPVERLFKTIGYQFSDWRLANNALTHRSVGTANNERLEFLGDAILGFVIADELCQQFGAADEGQLSRLRAELVKGDSLAALARELDLGAYLFLGTGELRSGGQSRNSILADTMEAIFAAIYLDGGYEASRQIILSLFQEKLSQMSLGDQQKDPKTRLQEHLQAHKSALPNYSVVNVSGEQHEQMFQVQCSVDGFIQTCNGSGSSRRKAEQDAAEKMLAYLSQPQAL